MTAARHDLVRTRAWLREGTALLLDTVASLPDSSFRSPCALPGWTRAHLVGHLARNAEALSRLAHWAASGEVTPMYTDTGQRAADIETSAALPVATLRAELAGTAADLDTRLAALDGVAWDATVRSALGREIPAREIVWMRIREVWLHAVDLDVGASVATFPPELVTVYLHDVASTLGAKPGAPALDLGCTENGAVIAVGPRPAESLAVITGTGPDLLAWLTGRSTGAALDAPGGVPALPPWI